MKKNVKTLQVIKKGILSTVLWTGTILGVLFVITFFAIQIPLIQTKIISTLSEFLGTRTDHEIKIEYVNISWFDSMYLEGVSVTDVFDSTMIESEHVMIDFSLLDLITEDDIILDAVQVGASGLYLQKLNDETAMNLSHFLRKIKDLGSGDGSKKLRIGKFKLQDGIVAINDYRKPPSNSPWDYHHIYFKNVDCTISDLTIKGDTIIASIDKLTAEDLYDDLNVRSLSSQFRFNNKSMVFSDLSLQTDRSHIQDHLEFHYANPANLSYFVDSVEVNMNLTKSIVHPKELQQVTPRPIPFDDPLELNGQLRGKVGRFELKDFYLGFGNSSYLSGYMSFNGLPDIRETFMDFRLKDAQLINSDLKDLVPETAHPYLDSLRKIEAKASFLGFYDDFVANGSFKTALGNVKSNLNLKLPDDIDEGKYNGMLELDSFRIGPLVRNNKIGAVTMNGSINGQGFDENADFFLNATFDELDYNDYSYNNIQTDAEFATQFFEGDFRINDPNLKFNIDGTIDLREGRDKVNFSGSLDTLNLKKLNLSELDIFVKTKLDLDFVGLHPDSIIGFADLNDLYIRREGRDINLKGVSVISVRNFDNRSLTIQSDNAKFSATGNFNYTSLYSDLGRIFKEYSLIFMNDEDSIRSYFSQERPALTAPYEIDLDLFISDADPILQLFTDDLAVGNNTEISGTFNHGPTTIVKVSSHLDTLLVGNNMFYNNLFELNTSKLSDSTNVLAMLFVSSEKQVISERTSFDDLYFEAIWADDKISFSSNVEQTNAANKARIFGDFAFMKEKYRLRLQPSEVTAIGREWQFSSNNEIYFEGGDVSFNNFHIEHDNQKITLTGTSSDETDKQLILRIDDFRLDNLNPLINSSLDGVLNTEAYITGRGDDLLVQSDITVDELELNDFLVGTISGNSKWENAFDRLRLGLEVDRLGRKVIQMGGYFYPREEEQLDVVANFDQTSLKVAEPFFSKNFSNVDGSLTGEFTIGGRLSHPVLKGRGQIDDGKTTVKYLNTDYTFNGEVAFTENEIGVRDLDIRDVNNNVAIANGGIFHDGFRDFVLDIKTDLKQFQVLNTNSTDNELYYGTAFLTGNVDFEGPLYNLQISATTTTNKNTRIFIPLTGDTDVVQEDFIKFVSLDKSNEDEESETTESSEPKTKFRGIKLDFDLDITPDAYTELIFDIKSGDIIRGRGNGKINLQINTDGDFLMFGDFVIASGGYNFTLKNIINKEFDLIEGSKISWFGDPYQGVMDITAEYHQLTSLLPLVTQTPSDELLESQDARRKYPAIVVLDLEGPLLTPEIDFDIRIEDYPESISGYSVGPMVNAFNSKISSDEQELKRQVFSLIVLRRFSPQNSFNVGGGQTLGSSVSEFISNQLSYWVSQVDENLEIDVDLTSLDQDAFNTFQLRLAYTFLDGRLKISRDGGFTNAYNETDVSAVVGDWTVEYLITSDGKLRAKMYNKTNYSIVNRALGDDNNTTAGFSIQYTKSFDQFRELLFKARKLPKSPKKDSEVPKQDPVVSPDEGASGNGASAGLEN